MTTAAPEQDTHLGRTYHTRDEARTYWAQRCQYQPTYSNRRVNAHMNNVEFLVPSLDAIAEDHGKRLVFGNFSGDPVSPTWLLNAADITDDEDAIVVANATTLAPGNPTPDILVAVEETNCCIRAAQPQLSTPDIPCPYPTWMLEGTPHPLGNVAYRVITMPFWWHNSSTSQGRLDQMRNSFEAALLMAIDREMHAETIAAAAHELRDSIAEMMEARSSENIAELRDEVPRLIREQADYERHIRQNNQRLDEIRIQLEALDETALSEDQLKDAVQIELDQLVNNPHIVTTTMEHGVGIVVHTRALTMRTPDGETADAGEFKITINFRTQSLTVLNLTRRLAGYDHPHVTEGHFCTGDQRRIVNQLMDRGEIAATIALVIDLLQHVNPDDTYTTEWRAWFDMD